MPMANDPGNSRLWDKNRVEAFSDGVFAIAITLLVLDITVPEHLRGLAHHLEQQWPAYLAYVTSFLTIGGVWIAHHRLFGALRYVDPTMMRINLLLLLLTGFLPFPTKILAEALRAPYSTAETAVVLYGATVLGIELVLEWLGRHADSHDELADLGVQSTSNDGHAAFGRWWRTPTIVLYFVAILIGILLSPKLAAAMYLVLAVPGVLLLDLRLGRDSRA
jgi:uncharacterized membrane protein